MLNWIIKAGRIAQIPFILSCGGMLFISLMFALFWGLFGILRKIISFPSIIIYPFIWVSLEYIRSFLFPWGFVGYSMWKITPLIQISDITGIYGLSFLVMMVSGFLCDLMEGKDKKGKIITEGLITFLILIIAFIYGIGRLHTRKIEKVKINIVVLHTETPQEIKFRTKYGQLKRYIELSEEGISSFLSNGTKPDLIVWPETALLFFFPSEKELSENLLNFVREKGVPILTGAIRKEIRTGEKLFFNTAYLITPDGVDFYDKIVLVPVGEYLPFRDKLGSISWIRRIIRRSEAIRGDITGGNEKKVFRTDRMRFFTPICWEVIFPPFTREFVEMGADFLINISNDAWFENTSAIEQHFVYGLFRSVENRVYLIRSSNKGISGIISPEGKVLEMRKKEGYISFSIPVYDGRKSFYTSHGDIFSIIILLISISLSLISLMKTLFTQPSPKTFKNCG